MIVCSVFLFNDTATTEIYTYRHTHSLHDALPISRWGVLQLVQRRREAAEVMQDRWCRGYRHAHPTRLPVRRYHQHRADANHGTTDLLDRKSTRLNSSH